MGLTAGDCDEAVMNSSSHGVSTCLDYSVEAKKTNEGFDQTVEKLIRMVEYAKHNPVSFCGCEANCNNPFALMEKISNKAALDSAEKIDWDRG